MNTPLSPAKITRPDSSAALKRHRLFRILDRVREPIVWITGPPGIGKTTLATSWIEVRKAPCLWYQVDKDDNDPSGFFYYMGLAAKKAAPQKRKSLPLLTPEYLLGIPTFSRRFFETLYDRMMTLNDNGSSPAVIFDNCQQVPEGSSFHQILYEGLSLLPNGVKVLLISRQDPPEAFIRLRANRLMKVIGWDELKFTPEESERMVRHHGNGTIPPEAIRQFHEKTDGWAAGIVLLLEGARNGGVESALSRAQSLKEIGQYFANEIFNTTERERQEFLLKTHLFPRMSAKMAEALTGNHHATRILSDLSERNLFTQKFDSETAYYQYHALFRDFLRFRAREIFDPEELRELGKKAALLLEENGQPENAFELFRKAEAWPEAIQLVLKQAPNLAGQGRAQTLDGWISAFPERILESDPWLLYWKGICLLAGSPPQSQARFRKALDLFRAGRDVVGTFLSLSGFFDSILFSFDTYKPFDEALGLLDEVLVEHPDFHSLEIEARLTASRITAIIHTNPGHPDVKKTVERALSLFQVIPDLNIKMHLLQGFLVQSLIVGEFQALGSLFESVRNQMLSRDVSPHLKIWFKVTEALLHIFTADFQKAGEAVEEGLELASGTGVHVMDYLFLGHGATAALNRGDLETADRFLRKMADSSQDSPYFLSFYNHLYGWKLYLEGQFSKSVYFEELSLQQCLYAGAPHVAATTRFGYALALHELKRDDEARKHLSECHDFALSVNSSNFEFTSFLLEAKIEFDEGNDSTGLISLGKALSIGRDKEYMNTVYCWAPAMMAELSQKALEAGIEVDYVRRLIRKRNLMPDPPPLDCEEWPWALRIYTLGRFEIVRDGKVMEFAGKVQKKPLEMLKVLVSNGGSGISEEKVTDFLWPDAQGDAAHTAFNMTLLRLRRLIGVEGAVPLAGGKVSLDPGYCWVDASAFERMCALLDKRIEAEPAVAGREGSKVLPLAEKAVAIYEGHFLPDDEGQFWTISYGERLRSRFSRLITRVGCWLENAAEWEKAAECYQKGIDRDDLSEEFYQHLMICHQRLGRRAKAIEVYNRCRKLLYTKIGIEPSTKTKSIYDALKN